MAGKFLKRDAIIDTVKGEYRVNAVKKRNGLTKHPVLTISCGCPDENCGAFHVIQTERTIPTPVECETLLIADKKKRKSQSKKLRDWTRKYGSKYGKRA